MTATKTKLGKNMLKNLFSRLFLVHEKAVTKKTILKLFKD